MLTNEDIQKLIGVFATKEDLRELISGLSTKEDFNKLFSAIDAYAKKADSYFQVRMMLAHKVDRLEKWILQIAERVGIQLQS